MKLDDEMTKLTRASDVKVNIVIEGLKIEEKINNKFFKACERGDLDKINVMLNKKVCKDRTPDINKKYLHSYSVLHVAISNSII